MKKRLGLWFAVAILALPGWAPAADVELPVPIQKYNAIRFYSLGVGVEERRQAPQLYPLKLVFKTDGGHMLCGADVTVSARGNTVFRGSAENGPWLFIDLPPGVYDVRALQDGKARSAKGVVVSKEKRRTVTMQWKTTEVKMGLP